MPRINIGLFLIPIAYAESLTVSVNVSGTATVVDDDRPQPPTLTVTASGSGTISPYGSATVAYSALVLGNTTGALKGTISFTVGAIGSLNGNFSQQVDNEQPPPIYCPPDK
jgi:hypothetical protein